MVTFPELSGNVMYGEVTNGQLWLRRIERSPAFFFEHPDRNSSGSVS
jgi:hypothetical protein